jgi:hypothetical protein
MDEKIKNDFEKVASEAAAEEKKNYYNKSAYKVKILNEWHNLIK